MINAKPRLTQTIHAPAFGSREILPLNKPTTTSSAHIPREKLNRYTNPRAARWVVVTHVRTAAMTGAEQGAATRPDTAPITRAPDTRPAVPAVDALATSADGKRTGITSSIESAAMISRFAIAK